MPQEQMTLKLGATIRDPSGGSYVIEGLLGKGGFGAVYLVRNRGDRQQLFALKGDHSIPGANRLLGEDGSGSCSL